MVTTAYQAITSELRNDPRSWLITGIAGFIGSNLLEALLNLNQRVVGLDNFSTGCRLNLEDVKRNVPEEQWRNFRLVEGDIRKIDDCRSTCVGVDYVLHHAAFCSVPGSIEDPTTTNAINVTGFLNMLTAAREMDVRRFVYASSSSVYGDDQADSKTEDRIGRLLSPYAVSKYANELYASAFTSCFGFDTVGLRYFNIFGRRQDPNGAYAAVIPRWFHLLIEDRVVEIYGDGETSRDFCYVDNVVQANLLAACVAGDEVAGEVYNIGVSRRTTLNELFGLIRNEVARFVPSAADATPVYRDFRTGDIRHSLADIHKAKVSLGYVPTHSMQDSLGEVARWFMAGAQARDERRT